MEGFGKTSIGCYFAKPIFLMSDGETGLETLIDNGLVPDTPHFPPITTWEEKTDALDFLLNGEHSYGTLVLDTQSGFERICHEYICRKNYKGDWSGSGFMSFREGYETSLPEWANFLAELDAIRERRKMAILGLCHVKISPFKNPEGSDYDRYTPAMHDKTWSLTHKWADAVFFGNYHTVVEDGTRKDGKAKKGKGKGGRERVLYVERTAAFDAKNRNGLTEAIDMGNSGQEAFNNLRDAIKAGKKVN